MPPAARSAIEDTGTRRQPDDARTRDRADDVDDDHLRGRRGGRLRNGLDERRRVARPPDHGGGNAARSDDRDQQEQPAAHGVSVRRTGSP